MENLIIEGFDLGSLLKLSPKDYYLRKSMSLPAGPDWICVPMKTEFDEYIAVSDGSNKPTITTLDKYVYKDQTEEELKLFLKIKTLLKETEIKFLNYTDILFNKEYNCNKKYDNFILKHLRNGVVMGKNLFVPNIVLMLEDLSNYLKGNSSKDYVELISICDSVIFKLKNAFSKKSFILKPVFFSHQENNQWQKITKTLKFFTDKDKVSTDMYVYLYFIRSSYLGKTPELDKIIEPFYIFFSTFYLELLSSREKNKLSMNVIDGFKFANKTVFFIDNRSKLAKDITILTSIFIGSDGEKEKYDIHNWTKRLFGKGYEIFKNHKLPIEGNKNQQNNQYDYVKITEIFNKMIEERLALHQKFHN